jgi:hypothetical protein
MPVDEEIKLSLYGNKVSAYAMIGLAKQQLSILENQMQLGSLDILSRTLKLSNGAVVVVSKVNNHREMNIYYPVGADVPVPVELVFTVAGSVFVFHAATDTFPKGMKNDLSAVVTGPYAFPLVDDDHGTFCTVFIADKWKVLRPLAATENYGNIPYLANSKVFSLRGPFGKQLEVNPATSIPGFSLLDETVVVGGIDTYYYSPFSKNVYYKGNTPFTLPILGVTETKVLGIAVVLNVVVVVLGTNYRGVTNPDETIGGFYTEVWKKLTTWERVDFFSDSRHTQSWFFSASGLLATNQSKSIQLTDALDTVTVTPRVIGEGTQTNLYSDFANGNWGITQSGSWKVFPDYILNQLAELTLILQASESSSIGSDFSETFTDLDLLISGVEATSLTITGPEAYGGPGAYTATLYPVGSGDCGGDIVWTYPSVSCGMGTVSATKGGLSGSMQVRMASGQWGAVTDIYYDAAAGGANHITEVISGGTRTTYVEGGNSNLHTWWTDYYIPFQGDCGNCFLQVNGCLNREIGDGLDYTYWPSSHTNGSLPTCCGPGGAGWEGLDYYNRTLRIYTQPWVC